MTRIDLDRIEVSRTELVYQEGGGMVAHWQDIIADLTIRDGDVRGTATVPLNADEHAMLSDLSRAIRRRVADQLGIRDVEGLP